MRLCLADQISNEFNRVRLHSTAGNDTKAQSSSMCSDAILSQNRVQTNSRCQRPFHQKRIISFGFRILAALVPFPFQSLTGRRRWKNLCTRPRLKREEKMRVRLKLTSRDDGVSRNLENVLLTCLFKSRREIDCLRRHCLLSSSSVTVYLIDPTVG